jgi:hypothetical protein
MNKTIVLDCYEFESRLLIDEKMRANFLLDDGAAADILAAILEANSGDPDYFMMDGRRCSFFDYDYESVKYVVYISEQGIDEIAERMLKKFFAHDYGDYFSREAGGKNLRSWDDFEALDYAIAYRGGVGYVYTIWKYGKGE